MYSPMRRCIDVFECSLVEAIGDCFLRLSTVVGLLWKNLLHFAIKLYFCSFFCTFGKIDHLEYFIL